MANRADVDAAFERLPWQQREGLIEAVREGQAVDDPDLAPLAVDYAEIRHRETIRTLIWVLGPSVGLIGTSAARGDDGQAVGRALTAGVAVFTIFAALVWAIALRPLVRARRANLHLAGLAEQEPGRRDLSHWVVAWFIAWPVAAIFGVGARTADLPIVHVIAFLAWLAVLWFTKRALDERAAPR